MQAPRRLQLRRGNTAAVNTYLGAQGELIINTDTNTLYIHDGVTVGGFATTVNIAVITNSIVSANVGMKGYVDAAIASNVANIAAGYTNTNVKSYLGQFDGNIIPSANAVYSLGSVTNQWKSLFVSNNTIYVGGVPLSIDNSGNLTINGNTIPTIGYVNTAVANVTVDLTAYALNANVTAANVGLKGYVDQANTIQSQQISDANVGMKGYVDNAVASIVIPETYSNVNVAVYLTTEGYAKTSDITTANVGLTGYVDQANTIQSAIITASNVAMKGYVDTQINNLVDGAPGLLDTLNEIAAAINDDANVFTTLSTAVTTANVGMRGYVDASIGNIAPAYSNANVASYLPTYSGGIAANISKAGYTWTFGTNGNITFPDATVQTTAANPTYINAVVTTQLPTLLSTYTGNITAENITITGNLVLTDGGNIIQQNFYGNTGQFYGDPTTGFGAFYAGKTGFTPLPQTIVQVAANYNSYAQVNLENTNAGNQSTADYVVTADNGTDTTYYVDMGIAGSGYNGLLSNNSLGTSLFPNDAYLYTQGNTDVSVGGNLVIGTTTESRTVKILSGGTNDEHIAVQINHPLSERTLEVFGNIYSPTIDAINDNITAANAAWAFANTIQSQQISAANVGIIGYIDQGNTIQAAAITAANVGIKGYVDFANTVMKAYVDGQIIAANANVSSSGGTNYSNVNVAAYLSTATINTTGNITAAYISGNISVTGNVTGTSPNVTIQAGVYNSVFDNQGNVTVPKLFTAGNIQTAGYLYGNGAFLTGIVASGSSGTNYSNVNVQAYTETMGFTNYSNVNVAAYISTQGITSYSNVQVATYLPTYSGNVANITLSPSGVLTFADGTTQTTAATGGGGGSDYGNANVATYLANSRTTFFGNTSTHPLSSNVTQIFIGNSTSLTSGNGTSPFATALMYNMYFAANNVPLVRNTQLGAGMLSLDLNGFTVSGLATSQTANAAPTLTNLLRITSAGAATFVSTVASAGVTSTGAIAVNSALGITSNQTSQLIFNQTVTSISMGTGAATTINLGTTNGTAGNVFVGSNLGTNLYNLRLRANGQYNLITSLNSNGGYGIATYSNIAVTGGSGNGMIISMSGVASGYLGSANITNPGTGYRNGDTITIPAGNPVGSLGGSFVLQNYNATKSSTQIGTGIWTFHIEGNLSAPGNITIVSNSSYFIGNAVGTTAEYTGNVNAAYFIGDGSQLTGIASGGSNYSNVNVQAYTETMGFQNYSNVNVIAYLAGNITTGNIVTGAISGPISDANTTITAGTYTTTFDTTGNVTVQGSVVANYLFGNGFFLTGVVTSGGGSGTNYSNVNVKAYTETMGFTNYSNVNVASYLAGNITTGNITTVGNITASGYIVTAGGYGNITQVDYITANNVVATANITVQGMGVTMPNRPAFRVNGTTQNIPQTLTANVNLKGLAISTAYNQGNYFDAATGKFTAPIAGIYSVGLNARVGSFNGLSQIAVLKNGTNTASNIACFWESDTNVGTAMHFGVNGTIILAVGDYLAANILAGNITFDQNDNWHVTYLG